MPAEFDPAVAGNGAIIYTIFCKTKTDNAGNSISVFVALPIDGSIVSAAPSESAPARNTADPNRGASNAGDFTKIVAVNKAIAIWIVANNAAATELVNVILGES